MTGKEILIIMIGGILALRYFRWIIALMIVAQIFRVMTTAHYLVTAVVVVTAVAMMVHRRGRQRKTVDVAMPTDVTPDYGMTAGSNVILFPGAPPLQHRRRSLWRSLFALLRGESSGRP